jgi:subtilisin
MAQSRQPDFRIPDFTVHQLVVTCSESMDWSLKELGIPELWKRTTGKGVKVAVLDTGCAILHPDLKNQIEDSADFTNSKVGPGDTNGHGTHCCGVIAAERNDVGVVGVAHNSKLLVGKVLNDYGVGSPESIAKGIMWAVEKKADVISMSFGAPVDDPKIRKAVKYAHGKGVILVAAAGNEGPGPQTVGYPGRYPEVISVAAVDFNRRIAKFSSRGSEVDIAAPGVDILSTYPPKNFAKLSGTSMAAPFVSGVIALKIAYERSKKTKTPPDLSHESILKQIKETSFEAGQAGFDNDYGWGLINAHGLIFGTSTASSKLLPKKHSNVYITIDQADFTPKGKAKFKQVFGEIQSMTFEFDLNAAEKGKKS